MNQLDGYDVEDLHPGMRATFSKTITEADIILFAGVSGDMNAIHIDQEYAATTPFKGRIAHGLLTASVVSAAVANRLPGPGAVYLSQQLKFLAPVRPGDTVHAEVKVTSVDRALGRVTLSTQCTVAGKLVLDGAALVKPTSSARRLEPRSAQNPKSARDPVQESAQP